MEFLLTYDRKLRIVKADDRGIVDLRLVKDGSKTSIYSKHSGDEPVLETTFRVVNSNHAPFDLEYAKLGPASFVKAIVENRLKIDGLQYTDEIEEVYRQLKTRSLDDIFHANEGKDRDCR